MAPIWGGAGGGSAMGSPEERRQFLTQVRKASEIGRQIYVEPGRRDEFASEVEARGSVWGFESRARRRDGSLIWIRENARGVRDASGRLLGKMGGKRSPEDFVGFLKDALARAKQTAMAGRPGVGS